MFPLDDYTPHGYLDLPEHSRNLRPKGVLRSDGLGFLWHYPSYAAGYGSRREVYRAGFRLEVGDARVSCAYHSKNLKEYRFPGGWVVFHPVGTEVLRARVELEVPVTLEALYHRTVAALGQWGESGLVGRREGELFVLQSFEDGEVFLLYSRLPLSQARLGDAPEPAGWPERGFFNSLGQQDERVQLYLSLEIGAGAGEVLMARGKTLAEAEENLRQARRHGAAEEACLRAEDAAFWEGAPRLEGDWPPHWRRGVVYDLETLRMVVKSPLGIYRHPWDAMQIQAPRVVLAEAAMDALALAYADPELAQQVFLGTFLDASAPNVPCSREDGSYNMVAADGTVCGTGPQWGYPFLVAEALYRAHPDAGWLETLYPKLKAYFEWWVARRSDPEGWLGFACSWESGQDNSPRFGEQPLGGGHPVRHVRPVDLHAAMAHAAGVMEGLALELDRSPDLPYWREREGFYAEQLSRLWQGSRYADLDGSSGQFVAVDDAMLLAPFALGVAGPAYRAAGLERVMAWPDEAEVWPMLVWTTVAAAWRLGLFEKAARLAEAAIDRAYRFWDAREAHPERTLPGIACEYWPHHGRCGGEGYGWGAFNLHHLLRYVVGYAPSSTGLALRPNLPPALRQGRYACRLRHHGRPLKLAYEASKRGVEVRIGAHGYRLAWGEAITLEDSALWQENSP